jgi:tRNA nucleotidyltransferase (CCA-adding enzyme)
MNLPDQLRPVIAAIISGGGNPYAVGGCVRDFLLDREPKDFDIEVFSISEDKLISILSQFGKVDLVGKSFGIIKLAIDGEWYDFSIPRRERKSGVGHQAFEVTTDPFLTLADAAARRDFTINAIYFDLEASQFADPYNGLHDLHDGTIRHTSAAFGEDPLRVLRAFQFCSRFDFKVAPETVELCRSLLPEFPSISKERLWVEFQKWAEKSIAPERGIQFLIDCGWITCFPELSAIVGVEQDARWHPEGPVEVHTMECLKAIRRIDPSLAGERKVILTLATLCHDLGKATHTQIYPDKITSIGHEKAGGPITFSFLNSIDCPHAIRDVIIPLVENHMLQHGNISDAVLRRAAVRIHPANLLDLCFLMEADKRGRPPHPDERPEKIQTALDIIARLGVGVHKPAPILLGRHLIERGIRPGKDMGAILKKAYEAQLDGNKNFASDTVEGLFWFVTHDHGNTGPYGE